jgi:hypothetical protein
MQREDPCPARHSTAAAEAKRSGNSDPARAKPSAIEAIRETSATVGLPDTGTIELPVARLTDSPTRILLPADPAHAAAMPTVPGYDLLAPLGEGGMGVVWKARQTRLNRLVALKMVLGEHRAGSKELIRFLAEAEAVAAIKPPTSSRSTSTATPMGGPSWPWSICPAAA